MKFSTIALSGHTPHYSVGCRNKDTIIHWYHSLVIILKIANQSAGTFISSSRFSCQATYRVLPLHTVVLNFFLSNKKLFTLQIYSIQNFSQMFNLNFLYLLIEASNICIWFLRCFFQLHDSHHWICIIWEHSHYSMHLVQNTSIIYHFLYLDFQQTQFLR
mgnify:CR=1 FL=1